MINEGFYLKLSRLDGLCVLPRKRLQLSYSLVLNGLFIDVEHFFPEMVIDQELDQQGYFVQNE